MSRQITLLAAWAGLIVATPVLVIGHFGAHDFRWTYHQISTYAARAPNGSWITAGMLLSALTLFCLGIAISLGRTAAATLLSRIASMSFGTAGSGLLMLACCQETAMVGQPLQQLGFEAIRQQTFHDAGLSFFFFGSTLAIALSGLIVVLEGPGWIRRMLGGVVASTGPAACAALVSSWPQFLGFSDVGVGIMQRGAFFCLWIGALLLLTLLTKTINNDM